MFFNFDPDGCQPNTNIHGVGIYISKRISVSEYYFTGSNFRDHIWISMSLKGCDSLLIGCIYRSPSCELLSSTNSLCELLKLIPSDKFSHILICGDFNYPNIDWLLPSASAHCEQLFLDTVQDLYLFQHVLETIRNRNSSSSLLDLVFTNEAGMISDIQYLPGLGLSDHVCLKFELICYGKYIQDKKPRYNLCQADFGKMRTLFEAIDWEDALNSSNIHQAWDVFASYYESILMECVLCHVPKTKKKNIYMTREALRIKKKKCKLWKQYKLSGTTTDYSLYCKARNELRSLTRSLRKLYEEKITCNIKTNQKVFWKYVNSRLKSRSSINCLQHPDGSMAHTNSEMANLFNDHFASVYTREDISSVPSFNLDYTVPTLNDIDITPSIVFEKLEKMDVNKSSGPDGWPLLSLKETALQVSVPLCILFNKSLSSGCLPASWKQAHVTPIHKKGNHSVADNYRPISLTSPIVQILESIIKDSITHHMLINNLFSPSQHGFIAGRSCTTQLLIAMDYWTQSLNDGYPVDIVYLDFCKAFDSVPHIRLLTKLKAYGISGCLLDWIQDFLLVESKELSLMEITLVGPQFQAGFPKGQFLDPYSF